MSVNAENLWKLGLQNNKDFINIKNFSDKEIINRICENSNFPHDKNGNEIIYDNEHFHCSAKGCEIEMRLMRTDYYGDYIIQKYCHKHNRVCSKTGWELGWYLGKQTKKFKNNNNRTKRQRSISPVIILKDGKITKTDKFYEQYDQKYNKKTI